MSQDGHGEDGMAKISPAVLQVKIKNKIKIPPGFVPESSPNHRSPWDNDSLDPPPDPPGGRDKKTQLGLMCFRGQKAGYGDSRKLRP